MKRKQEELIQYLYEHDNKITSETLSKALSLSVRTIKSYISELNFQYPNLILSSNRGYTIHRHKVAILLQHKDELPQDYEGRCIYIVKKLLLGKQNDLNIFDLCDELFVSYSTLKNDIYRMNTSFANFQISFSCLNDTIQIKGTEKDKRRLISHVMSEEASGNFLDLSFVQESFPEYDIEKACTMMKDVFHRYQYYINDFSFINFILHITIMIHRVHHGNHILYQDDTKKEEDIDEKEVVEALCQALESAFALTLTQAEKFEIYVLLKMNANHHMKAQINELAKMVNDDTFSIANKIIKEVDQHYFVNLMSDSFMTPFVLHLKHLRNRLHLHSSIKNPMLESIKISCPTIYDISTFMAYQLMQEFHEEINEDEIAFLALHVGTEIERQNKAETKATCILLCPEYLGISTHLYNKILLDFGEQLNIKKLISFENELQQETFDILITTLPVSRSGNYVTVQLPPFPMNYEKNKILEAVTRIEKIKKGKLLADNIDLYFNQNLFYLKQGDADKNTIITELADQMITLGYVGDDFKDEVWKREKASSTAFMNIAIPHPMKMSAYKSSIAVAISPKGIEWKEHHLVNVVFMIAFNMIDNKQFHSLYESLILLFNEPNVITEIKKCKSFKDFKQIIIRNYMKIIE